MVNPTKRIKRKSRDELLGTNAKLTGINRLVPDTSAIINQVISKNFEKKKLKFKELILHHAMLAELENQANSGREIGFMGLDEIKKLRELSFKKKFKLSFAGNQPTIEEIKFAKKGGIDSKIRKLAEDMKATLITSDMVQAEVGKATGMAVIHIPSGISEADLSFPKLFKENYMSVHLKEGIPPRAKQGRPGKWTFEEIDSKPLTSGDLEAVADEIIEAARSLEDSFLEIERKGSIVAQIKNYRIVITRPPLSNSWEITLVRPVKKLELKDYKLSKKMKERLLERAEGILIAGAPGHGKCHGKDTPILMYDGSVKMVQYIKKGDLIMGPDSKPRTVLGTNKGQGKLYKVNPVKGDPYIVNEDHMLSLKYNNHSKEKTINISVRDFLNSSKYLRERYKGYRTNIDFAEREISIDPYFLGLWLGDGISASPRIANADPSILEFLNSYAQEEGLVLRQHSYKSSTACQIYGLTTGQRGGGPSRKNPLLNKMKELGIINNKHIPDVYKINSNKIRLQVLAGLLDTDGHLFDNCFEITTKSIKLKENILYLTRSLGFAAYNKEKTINNKKYYRIIIAGDASLIPTKIKKKIGRLRKQVKNVLRTGITIKSIGKGEYYGFELDKDGLYCLGDFTVTHNSTFTQALAKTYAEKNKIVKSLEAPRDLQLPPSVTQLSTSKASHQELKDIMLLTRPDYTVYDEVRDSPDFKLFADLRLSGVGMVGVVHATNPIDAIQRFIGKVELGMIPHIIDTVIFIKDGKVEKAFSLKMNVKTPSGFNDDDLARPVVDIYDFETGELDFEIYTFGEATVVVPVKKDGIEVVNKRPIRYRLRETSKYYEFRFFSNARRVDLKIGEETVATFPVGRSREVRVYKKSKIGQIILEAIATREEIQFE